MNKLKTFAYRNLLLLTISTFCLIIIGTLIRLTHSGLSCPDWPLCYELWIVLPSKIEIIENEIPYKYSQIIYEWGHRFYAGIVVTFFIISNLIVSIWMYFKTKEGYSLSIISLILLMLIIQIALGSLTVSEANINWSVAIHLIMAFLIYSLMINNLAYYDRNLLTKKLENLKWVLNLYMILYFLNLCLGAIISTSGVKDLNYAQIDPFTFVTLLHIIVSLLIIGLHLYIVKYITIYKLPYLKIMLLTLFLYIIQMVCGILSIFYHDIIFINLMHQLISIIIFTFFSYYYWVFYS